MEEKPVRKTDRAAVDSLCLGILGYITSFLFIYIFLGMFHKEPGQTGNWLVVFYDWWWTGGGNWILTTLSTVLSLIGLSLGVNARKRTNDRTGLATLAVILNSMALLAGFPVMIPVIYRVITGQ